MKTNVPGCSRNHTPGQWAQQAVCVLSLQTAESLKPSAEFSRLTVYCWEGSLLKSDEKPRGPLFRNGLPSRRDLGSCPDGVAWDPSVYLCLYTGDWSIAHPPDSSFVECVLESP